jgi:hypothetical protein
MNLNKEDSENTNEYIWRICDYKNKGLLDLNWDEIGEIINKELFGQDVELYRTSSAYRKPYQYARDFYDDVFKKKMLDDDYDLTKDLENIKREIQKERIKLNTAKLEYNRDIRKQSRFELFYEDIKNSIEKLEVPKFEYNNDVEPSELEYILTIADIHCGAQFECENNYYSLEECKERFNILFNETVAFIKNKGLKKIHVLELGDSIQNILRLNDLKINQTSVVEATVYVAKLISSFLNGLSKYCEVIYYHCPTSNHSQIRYLDSKASELATEDIEYIICNYIKDVLSDNERVTVNSNFGKEYIDFEIFNYNIIAMHGHQIKNIENSLKDLTQLRKVFYDIVFLAHYHAGKNMTVGENLTCDAEINICPSFIGSDPYSNRLLKGAKAACNIYGISRYGAHTETYKIILN